MRSGTKLNADCGGFRTAVDAKFTSRRNGEAGVRQSRLDLPFMTIDECKRWYGLFGQETGIDKWEPALV